MKKLKDIDKKILTLLLKNGRDSYASLARKCGISRQSVFGKVKSLVGSGIVKRFTIEIDPRDVGLNLKAYILVQIEPMTEFRKRVEKNLKRDERIAQFHYLFGRFDILLEVIVKNRDELAEVVRDIHRFRVVKKTETFIVYETTKNDQKEPILRVFKGSKLKNLP